MKHKANGKDPSKKKTKPRSSSKKDKAASEADRHSLYRFVDRVHSMMRDRNRDL